MRRLLSQCFHQRRRIGVFGKPGRLSSKQRRELPVPRRAKRPRQTVLRGKCYRLQTRGDEVVGELVPDIAGGPPRDHVGDDGRGVVRLAQSRSVGVKHIGFLAAQKRAPKLHAAGTQHERRRHLPTIGNAARRDDRHAHGIDDLRQQCEETPIALQRPRR